MRRAASRSLTTWLASGAAAALLACAPTLMPPTPAQVVASPPLDALALADEPRPIFAAHVRGELNALDLRLADLDRRRVHLSGRRAVHVELRRAAIGQRRDALEAAMPQVLAAPALRWPAARAALLDQLGALERDAEALWVDVARPPARAQAEKFRFPFRPFW